MMKFFRIHMFAETVETHRVEKDHVVGVYLRLDALMHALKSGESVAGVSKILQQLHFGKAQAAVRENTPFVIPDTNSNVEH